MPTAVTCSIHTLYSSLPASCSLPHFPLPAGAPGTSSQVTCPTGTWLQGPLLDGSAFRQHAACVVWRKNLVLCVYTLAPLLWGGNEQLSVGAPQPGWLAPPLSPLHFLMPPASLDIRLTPPPGSGGWGRERSRQRVSVGRVCRKPARPTAKEECVARPFSHFLVNSNEHLRLFFFFAV